MKRNVPDWTREFSASEVVQKVIECDLFISLAPWRSHSLQELLASLKPRSSMGFFDDFLIQAPLNFTQHSADLMFEIPRMLDEALRLEDFAAPPVLDIESRRIAQSIRQSIPPTFRILLVHADTGQTKMWPADRFVHTLDAFLDHHPDFLVLLVGSTPQPLDSGRNAAQVLPCYGLPLGVALSLVGLADIFLGVDSCMLHAADLYRIPGVGLFGNSNPVEYGFRFSPASIVVEDKSMESIEVEPVLDALELVTARISDNGL
jgi:ADP-heptose:LPS heptosyltransferase